MAKDRSRERFAAYVEARVEVIGHADRAEPLRDYCLGLLMPGERKSVEPMAAVTTPARVAENDLKLWRKDMWCIPQVDGTHVARMEDVLDLYAEAPDPKRPLVCFDESPTQLIGEVRQPIPAQPGQRERYDYEHDRHG